MIMDVEEQQRKDGFVAARWFDPLRPSFSDAAMADRIWQILSREGFTSKRALGELTEGDLQDVLVVGEDRLPRGDVRLLLSLTRELNPSKRARVNNGSGTRSPLEVEGEARSMPKIHMVRFLGGKSLESTSSKDVQTRVREAEVMMRAGDPRQFDLLGLGPRFQGLVKAEEVRQLTTEVIATVMSGTKEEEASAICQTLWRLGGVVWWTGAQVWKEDRLLDSFLKGEWEKYDWTGLTLRDFSDNGRFAVSRIKLVDSTFVMLLVGAMKGVEALMVAMFAAELEGCTEGIRGRLYSGFASLSTMTQLALAACINDAFADALMVLGRAATGAAGVSLEGPVNVKAHLVHCFAKVVLPSFATAVAVGKNFDLHRSSMYVLGEETESGDQLAPETGGGGAEDEEEVGAEVHPLVCVDYLRGLFGQMTRRSHGATTNGKPVSCHFGEKHPGKSCPKLHVKLNEVTKGGLKVMVEKAGVDVEAKWAQSLLQAIDQSTELEGEA